jgi:hypothetical protein
MKATWKPSWDLEHRRPAFINEDSPSLIGYTTYGRQKYLWGNVPAIDVVNHLQNEGGNLAEHLNLLFAGKSPIFNLVWNADPVKLRGTLGMW